MTPASIGDFVAQLVGVLGYPGLVLLMALEHLFPPIPSELILPLAGFEVGRGNLDFVLTLTAATAGSLAGTSLLYALARRGGRPLILRARRATTRHSLGPSAASTATSPRWWCSEPRARTAQPGLAPARAAPHAVRPLSRVDVRLAGLERGPDPRGPAARQPLVRRSPTWSGPSRRSCWSPCFPRTPCGSDHAPARLLVGPEVRHRQGANAKHRPRLRGRPDRSFRTGVGRRRRLPRATGARRRGPHGRRAIARDGAPAERGARLAHPERDYTPKTHEEIIVALADKATTGESERRFGAVMQDKRRKFGAGQSGGPPARGLVLPLRGRSPPPEPRQVLAGRAASSSNATAASKSIW